MAAIIALGVQRDPICDRICIGVYVDETVWTNSKMSCTDDALLVKYGEILEFLKEKRVREFQLVNGRRVRFTNSDVVACSELEQDKVQQLVDLLCDNGLQLVA